MKELYDGKEYSPIREEYNMVRNKFLAITLSALLVFISGCNLAAPAAGTTPVAASATDPVPGVPLETQVALAVAATYDAQTAVANSAAATLAAMVSNTPEFTFTPSLTPTLTFTLTPNAPMVSVSVQTNCRSGPGSAYDIVGVFNVGQTSEIVGRSAATNYWIVKLPSNPTLTCTLWGQYATVVGDTSGLPVVNPPPTPTPKFTNTPTPNFTVSFVDTTSCSGEYAFQFQVDNTGSITWESIRIILTDNTAASTTTHVLDSFRSYEVCAVESNQLNLEPGEGGHVANVNPGQLSYDPAGHNFTAVFRLCSLDGLAGTCLDKTITFTP
jgi:hypothetical protein